MKFSADFAMFCSMTTPKRKDGLQGQCPLGSEEQHLDMCEDFGEQTLAARDNTYDDMLLNYNMDMAEENREGDDLSGDEHSSGLQGGEVESHHRTDTGIPGDLEIDQEYEVDRRKKRRPD